MYLLVIDPNERDRQSTQRMLAERGHVVTAVADTALATRVLRQSTFDGVLVDAVVIGPHGSFLQDLRTEQRTSGLYVVVTALKRSAGDMSEVFLAGGDDFLPKPYGRDELYGRVEGISRLKRWAAQAAFTHAAASSGVMRVASAEPVRTQAAAARALSGTYELTLAPQCSELVSLAAWKTLDRIALADVSQMFDLPFALVDEALLARWTAPANGFGTSITLSLAREQLEIRLAVETDALSARTLAERVVGAEEVSAAAIADLLGEVANTLAGAFSRAAAAEGMSFTAGLPGSAMTGTAAASAPVLPRWFGLAAGDIQLYVCGVARIRPNLRIRTGELREGMVLANDLTNENGALLVRAGTRLTSSTVSRVQRMLAGHEVVEVADAA